MDVFNFSLLFTLYILVASFTQYVSSEPWINTIINHNATGNGTYDHPVNSYFSKLISPQSVHFDKDRLYIVQYFDPSAESSSATNYLREFRFDTKVTKSYALPHNDAAFSVLFDDSNNHVFVTMGYAVYSAYVSYSGVQGFSLFCGSYTQSSTGLDHCNGATFGSKELALHDIQRYLFVSDPQNKKVVGVKKDNNNKMDTIISHPFPVYGGCRDYRGDKQMFMLAADGVYSVTTGSSGDIDTSTLIHSRRYQDCVFDSDSEMHIYLLDQAVNQVVKLSLSSSMLVNITTRAFGFQDGMISDAMTRTLTSLAYWDRNIFVTDAGNHALRRIFLNTQDECTSPFYYGEGCDEFDCFGVPEVDGGVCSSNGNCISPDVCVCDTGYYDPLCHSYECFSVHWENSTVCSGNGDCDTPDHCMCDGGWTSENCQHPLCYGIISTNRPNVCSGGGDCIAPDTCECGAGYSGSQCQHHWCSGVYHTYSSVCTSHGDCPAPDTCVCDAGYSGSNCQFSICYGISSNETSVCSSQGSCDTPQNCNCYPGYAGDECQWNVCFGHWSNDEENVCTGRGNCTAPNTCSCEEGYGGIDCQWNICYGLLSNDIVDVCMGRGSCLAPNNCTCHQGYSGDQCEFNICFEVPSNVNQTCSSRGACIAPNKCLCDTGYGGRNCEFSFCHGVLGNESSVCSSHGDCTAPETCSCDFGQLGSNCEINICYGMMSNETAACTDSFTRGSCVDADHCHCFDGYTGSECELNICYDVSSNETSVCTARGNCDAPDTCTCEEGYDGGNCQWNICFGFLSNNTAGVCTGRGSCVSPNSCLCDQGYSGVECELNICYDIPSNESHVCDGHGVCVDADSCQCAEGYGGENCQWNICFNILANESSVCTSHGSCDAPETCTCNEFYDGTECQHVYCFSVLSNFSNTCAGHGECIGPDLCECDDSGYGAENCQYPICYGLLANHSMVCSQNGTCIRPDTCNCTSGFVHSQCETPVCFGIVGNESSVCGMHGACTSPDQCVCEEHYVGQDCMIPVCYGKNASNPLVCAAHGVCTAANECACTTGYHSLECELIDCFGVLSNASNVCSGEGECRAPHTCHCNDGYTGPNCEVPVCYDILGNITDVCSTFGLCVSANNCVCNMGYHGHECQWVECFGHLSNESSVCTARGNCTIPNQCRCETGYTGDMCQHYICFDIPSNENSSVCSGHGTCSNVDVCQCEQGYSGEECQFNICFDILSNESSVCASHGSCDAPDTCVCNESYDGPECQFSYCFGMLSNESAVCSSHGECSAPNQCACQEGLFGGTNCQYPICFHVLANETDVCSAHGFCVGIDSCNCIDGFVHSECQTPVCFGIVGNTTTACDSHGSCVAPNDCQCQEGYVGEECTIPVCYGINGTDPMACSSRGSCITPNSCLCDNHYLGAECNVTHCHGELSNSTLVCSGQGTCTAYQDCTCEQGFGAENCQYALCFGLLANHSMVCSQNGTCVRPDTCNCTTGFVHSQCEKPVCFGIVGNESSVCTMHGLCISPDRCVCDANYVDEQCSTPVCFGLNATNPNVCSFHGVCVDVDSCTCFPGFHGLECEYIECFSHLSNESTVCSNGQGACVAPDVCECSLGYNGNDCSLNDCFGYLSNDTSKTCSGFGQCVAPDLCNCSIGHTGNECEFFVCLQMSSNDSEVCSSRGTCIEADQCECDPGYGGPNCEFNFCSGVLSNESTVCQSNGNCTDSDSCVCVVGFSGENCELSVCFGIQSNETHSCSDHGECVAPDTCDCWPGYMDDECSTPVCFGINASDPHTCNMHGDCVLAHTCACQSGYAGQTCELNICFGMESNNSASCSGRGSCIAPQSCSCLYGYAGAACEMHYCFGILSNESDVCGGRGICSDFDNCQCDVDVYGHDCQVFNCYGIWSNDSRVCSSHGTCQDVSSCACDTDFHGEQCEYDQALPVCFGTLATHPTVCNGHGMCVSDEVCECDDGFGGNECEMIACFGEDRLSFHVCSSHGVCEESNMCECDDNYFGPRCQETHCFGHLSNSSEVCSQRQGACISTDFCECFEGYSGVQCEFYYCGGVFFEDESVCNGQGICHPNKTCTCVNNFSGTYCEDVLCGGIVSRDPTVCSSHGECILQTLSEGMNPQIQCICESGYSGQYCENHTCDSISNSDPTVCSSRGTCVAVDVCECEDTRTGKNCEIPVCYFIPSYELEIVCSGNGVCNSSSLCDCFSGYYGNECEYHNCFGVPFNASFVCSQNGECVLPDACSCEPHRFGYTCEHWSCYNSHHKSQDACSGHGLCIDVDTCNCSTGYTGDLCEYALCDGIPSNKPEVCSGHGSCVGYEQCQCVDGFEGATCLFPICYGKSEMNLGDLPCSGNGICDDENQCLCNGSYLDMTCSIPVCFGELGCANGAECVAPDQCDCNVLTQGQRCEQFRDFFIPVRPSLSEVLREVDDYTTDKIPLESTRFRLNGTYFSHIRISSDGYLAFVHEHSDQSALPDEYTQFSFTDTQGFDPLVLFGFHDMNIHGDSSSLHYRQSSPQPNAQEQQDLDKLTQLITSTHQRVNRSSFVASWYFVLSAESISHFPSTDDLVNNVQVILVCDARSDESFIIFNFKQSGIQYPERDALIGVQIDEASVNIADGLESSQIHQRSNIGLPGFYIFDTQNLGPRGPFTSHTCFSLGEGQMCSGHGECTNTNQCSCDEFWHGSQCEFSCKNQTKWFGDYCNFPVCFGVPSFDAATCSGHGNCVSPFTCECDFGYSGLDCSLLECDGIESSDPSVCAGHGTCISPQQCQCDDFYILQNGSCDAFTCWGILPQDSTVCGGHGTCASENLCIDCQAPYFGNNCGQLHRYLAPDGSDEMNVCVDRENPCETILHALDVSQENDQISFLEGEYLLPYRSIIVSKNISFVGEGKVFVRQKEKTSPSLTAFQIVFEGDYRVLRFVNIQFLDFTNYLLGVRNSAATRLVLEEITLSGAGLLYSLGPSSVHISNSHIANISSDSLIIFGGEMYNDHVPELHVQSSLLQNIHCVTLFDVQLENAQVLLNNSVFTSIQGSFVRLHTGSQISIQSSKMSNLRSVEQIISVNETLLSMKNIVWSNLTLDQFIIAHSSEINIENTEFSETTTQSGDFMQLIDCVVTVLRSRFDALLVHGNSSKNDAQSILNVSGSDRCTISHSEFSHVSAAKSASSRAISFTDAGNFFINNCTFDGFPQSAVFVGGVLGAVSVSRSTFMNSGSSSTIGGCIQVVNAVGSVSIESSSFHECKAIFGGGAVAVVGLNSLHISHSSFSVCHSGNIGGAIYLLNIQSVFLRSSSFSDCSAVEGGAVHASSIYLPHQYFLRAGGLHISNSTFDFNYAIEDGGAIACAVDNILKIHNTSFRNNKAKESGGAISLRGSMQVPFTHTSALSALFFTYEAGLVLSDLVLQNNEANIGGGIHMFSAGIIGHLSGNVFLSSIGHEKGGGMYIMARKVHIENSKMISCFAGHGSCIYAFLIKDTLSISNTSFLESHATAGTIYHRDKKSSLHFVGVTIEGCEAFNESGGVVSHAPIVVENSRFVGNRGANGGAISVSSSFFILGSEFKKNSANLGGAIHSHQELSSSCVVENSEFSSNEAIFGGSLYIYAPAMSSLVVNQSIFADSAQIAGGTLFHHKEIEHHFTLSDHFSSSLSYGDIVASPPDRLLILNVESDTEGVFFAQNASQSIFDVYPGQPLKFFLQSFDQHNQQISFLPGFNIRPITSAKILPNEAQMLRNGVAELSFSAFGMVGEKAHITFVSTEGLSANVTIHFVACPIGYRILIIDGVNVCERCPKGSYSITRGSTQCIYKCDTFSCYGGADISWFSGYWNLIEERDGLLHARSLPCLNGHCKGGNFELTQRDGTPFPQILTSSSTKSRIAVQYMGAKCSGNRHGILCGQCEEGTSEWHGTCVPCKKGFNFGGFVLFIGYSLLLCLWIHVTSQNDNDSAATRILIGFAQNVMISINFKQWISIESSEGGKKFIAFITDTVGSVTNMQFPSLAASGDSQTISESIFSCPFDRPGLWYFGLQILENLIPFFVFFIALGLLVSLQLCCSRRPRSSNTGIDRYISYIATPLMDDPHTGRELSRQSTRCSLTCDDSQSTRTHQTHTNDLSENVGTSQASQRSDVSPPSLKQRIVNGFWFVLNRYLSGAAWIRSILSVVVFAFQPIAFNLISFLLGCIYVNGEYVFIEKTNVQCYSNHLYWAWAIFFYVPLLFVVVAVPCAIMFLFSKKKYLLNDEEFAKYFDVWYGVYRRECYWFEGVQFVRKCALIFCSTLSNVLLLNFGTDGLEYVFFSIIFSANFLILIQYNPYTTRGENIMEKMSYFLLIIMIAAQEGSKSKAVSFGVIFAFIAFSVHLVTLSIFALWHNVLVRKLRRRLKKRINEHKKASSIVPEDKKDSGSELSVDSIPSGGNTEIGSQTDDDVDSLSSLPNHEETQCFDEADNMARKFPGRFGGIMPPPLNIPKRSMKGMDATNTATTSVSVFESSDFTSPDDILTPVDESFEDADPQIPFWRLLGNHTGLKTSSKMLPFSHPNSLLPESLTENPHSPSPLTPFSDEGHDGEESPVSKIVQDFIDSTAHPSGRNNKLSFSTHPRMPMKRA